MAAMTVGGLINQDTQWQGEVLIESSVVVAEGSDLTVQPGTIVRFKHYRGYRNPDDRLRLEILGNLIANGTAEKPIYFTSDAAKPQNGDWSMIHVRNASNSQFQYCVIEFGQQGLNFWSGSPNISNCLLRWNNWEGLYFESYCQAKMDHCHVIENGYNGLAAEQFCQLDINQCLFERNGTNGVHIDASKAEVRSSRILNNQANGLSVDNNGSLRAIGVTIENNRDCGIGIGEGHNRVETANLKFVGNRQTICGPAQTIQSETAPPATIDLGFTANQKYAPGYIPGDPLRDHYLYVYPEDETRRVVKKIGKDLGLTWSLAWDGRSLWTATVTGDLFQLDPNSGKVLKRFNAPGPQPWGMTFDGKHLWVVDFAQKQLSKVSPKTGAVQANYPLPDTKNGCKGICWDGRYLCVMGWASPVIYQLDRQGKLAGTIRLDNGGGGGIAWDGQYFWIPGGGKILRYDRQGKLTGWIYVASEGTWDMTWDGRHLWASQRTNENWRDAKLFALDIKEVKPWPDSDRQNEQIMTETTDAETSEFSKLASDANWREVFFDSCTDNWQNHWMLDGLQANITHSEKGMDYYSGPTAWKDACHAVLWTKQSFAGDIKIEYEYTRLEQTIRFVNILYLQATGSGQGPLCHWRNAALLPIYEGRIGLRHMYTRGARYKNFRVSLPRND